ncbi:asparagine synthase-related protein [Spongiactinospora gelatinilytica]|uniref:asparagine synthase-related protein n=1 Tax=Spongiactinospora gelatinilytica TaxID=2666298 RepID=UPI001313DEE7|nr:asparagine synthase-related protein [Spongiactinospora gelatinilytica]
MIKDVFPVPPETITADECEDEGATLLAWSNEESVAGRPPLIARGHRHAMGISGHLTADGDGAKLAESDSLGEAAASLGGCFSAFRIAQREIQAVTVSTRACPVFYAETSELHIVGNRALHVHLVATGGSILWDEPALQSMIRQGYFLSDETPYLGVQALGPSSSIVIRGASRVISATPLPQAQPVPSSSRAKRAAIANVGHALINAVTPLRSAPEPVNLALTGGRDSRLMAALLHAAKIPFRATTNGLDDHPDVVIARQIAAKLRIEHTIIPPAQTAAKDAIVIPHPQQRTYDVLKTCEGMTSAYESIVEYLPYSAKPTMSGQSGEILRGGFLYSQNNPAEKAMLRRIKDFFLKNEKLFTAEANDHAETLAAPWEARAQENPWEVLDHLYVTYRVGRWHAGARVGSLRRGNPIQPFLDNRVVSEALSLDQQWRYSEEVVHGLIRQFAPALRAMPLEGAPWRFTANRPPSIWSRLRSAAKAASTTGPSKKQSGWNWRTSPGPVLSQILGEYVIDRADALANIVRPDELKRLFEGPSVSQPALVWNLYTVAAMLTNTFPGDPPIGLEQVHISIPRP